MNWAVEDKSGCRFIMRQLAFKLNRELGVAIKYKIFGYIGYQIYPRWCAEIIDTCWKCGRINALYKHRQCEQCETNRILFECQREYLELELKYELEKAKKDRDFYAEEYRRRPKKRVNYSLNGAR